jgi:pimeloyl-ACP methyl ester carboxylesterase
MAHDAVAFIRALGFDQVDLLGFSLGGFLAQVIALEESGSCGRSFWRARARREAWASRGSAPSPRGTSSAVR